MRHKVCSGCEDAKVVKQGKDNVVDLNYYVIGETSNIHSKAQSALDSYSGPRRM